VAGILKGRFCCPLRGCCDQLVVIQGCACRVNSWWTFTGDAKAATNDPAAVCGLRGMCSHTCTRCAPRLPGHVACHSPRLRTPHVRSHALLHLLLFFPYPCGRTRLTIIIDQACTQIGATWSFDASLCVDTGITTADACQEKNSHDPHNPWVFQQCSDIPVRFASLFSVAQPYNDVRQMGNCGVCESEEDCGSFFVQQYLRCHTSAAQECDGRAAGDSCGGSCDDQALYNSYTLAPGVCLMPWPRVRPGDSSMRCPLGSVSTPFGCVDYAVLNKVIVVERLLQRLCQ